MRMILLLVAPVAVVVGVDRPAALIVLCGLAVFVTVLARVGLWLVGDPGIGEPDVLAARAGAITFASGTALAASLLLIGPLTALLVAPATLFTAWRCGLVRPVRTPR